MARQINPGDPGAGYPSKTRFEQSGTIAAADLTIADTVDPTKTAEFDLSSQGHNTRTLIKTGSTSTDVVITLPATSGTLITSTTETPSYGIVQPITGTSPTAAIPSDILTLSSGDNSVSIIGNATTDTLDFRVAGSYTNVIGTLDGNTKSNDGASVLSHSLYLQSADASFPGLITTGTQTIAGTKTATGRFNTNGGIDRSTAGTLSLGTDSSTSTTINIGNSSATINIQGSTIFENTQTLTIADPTIVLNKGGAAASASSSGITLEENSSITAYVQTSGDRNSWTAKAPNTAGIVTITPGSGGFTVDQGSHNSVTLAAVGSSPNANGASLSSQVLNLQPADGTNPGVITTGTQTIAGTKTFSSTISGTLSGNATNVSGIVATSNGGTGANLTAVPGSVVFANSAGTALTQNNSNFFWDNTNSRLGIGTAAPISSLDVRGSASTQGLELYDGANRIAYMIPFLNGGRWALASGNQFVWSSSPTDANVAHDTGLLRQAAGIVRVTDGNLVTPGFGTLISGAIGIGTVLPISALDIVGSFYSRSQTLANNAASCDFSLSNNAKVTYTTGNAPSTFTLTNMQDGGVYKIVTVVGATIGTFAFAQSGLTFVYSPANATVISTTALYEFTRIGSTVYVNYLTGFV